MNKNMKKGMAILLVVAMLFTMMPAGAFASTTSSTEAMWGTSADNLDYSGTFAEAIAAAVADNSTVAYIKLLRDVTIVDNDDVDNDDVDSQSIYRGNFTLDLNGCTVDAASDIAGFDVSNEGTVLTITDTSTSQEGNITITPFGEGMAAPPVSISSGASVILEAGTLAGNVGVLLYESGGSFIMNGGKIDATEAMFIHGGMVSLNAGEITSIYDAISMSGASGFNVTIDEDVTITAEWGNTISYASGSLDLESANCNEWSIMNYMDSDTLDIQYPEGYSLQDAAGNKIKLTFDSSATLRNHEEHSFGDDHKCTVSDCSAVEPHAWDDNGICACGVSADMRITDNTGSVSYAMAEDLYDEPYTNVTVDIMHDIKSMVIIVGTNITINLHGHCIDGSANIYGGLSVYDMDGTSQIVGPGVIKGDTMGTLELLGNVTVGAGVELETLDGVPDIIVYENTVVDLSESSCGGWIIEYYPMSSDADSFSAENITLPAGHSLLGADGNAIKAIEVDATATISQCVAQESSHACACGNKVSECADNDNDGKCDVCGAGLCAHTDAGADLICDSCGVMLGECENWQNHSWDTNADGNVVCDVCGKYADLKITAETGEISYATAREVRALTAVAYPNAYAGVSIDVLRDIEAGLWISASDSTVNLNGYTVTDLALEDFTGKGTNTILGPGIVNTSSPEVLRPIGVQGNTVIDNVTIETASGCTAILFYESFAENKELTIQNCDCEGWIIENGGERVLPTVHLPKNYVLKDANDNTITVIEASSKATIRDGRQMPTVTAPAANTLTYNGAEQALVTAGSAEGGTMQYSTYGDNWSTDIPAGKAAGDYTVYYRVQGDVGYKDIEAQSVAVTIAPKALTVKEAAAENKICDGTADVTITSVTVDGIMSGDNVSPSANIEGTLADSKADTYKMVNLSKLSLTGDDSKNYTIDSEAANVPLNSAVTITHSCSDEWSSDEDNHWHKCTGCDEKVDCAAHIDENEKDHKCDVCGVTMSECKDTAGDSNHKCDICGKENVTAHTYTSATCTTAATCTECGENSGEVLGHIDANNDHICDRDCGNTTMGTHAAAEGKHTCDYCGEAVTQCADDDPKDHKCDICDTTLTECKDENNDEKCDICGAELMDIYVGGSGLQDGQYIDNNGTISDTQPSGGYAYYNDGTLELHNYVFSGQGTSEQNYNQYAVIYALGDLNMELYGVNQLTSTAGEDGDVIMAEGNITIDGNGDGALIVTGAFGISAEAAISIRDVESLQITTEYYDGIYSGSDVSITDSVVIIKAARDGIYSYDGDISINGTEVKAVVPEDSYPYISGTRVDITAGKDGAAIFAASDFNETPLVTIDEKLAVITPENGTVITVTKTFEDTAKDYKYATISADGTNPAASVVIEPKAYQVTLKTESGTFGFPAVPDQSVAAAYGADFVTQLNTIPQKDGYTFKGWYSDEALTQPYDFSTKVIADVTLYQKWEEVCQCVDENPKDHKCDECNATLSQCADASPKDHKCDVCGVTLSECKDEEPADGKCDICGADYGTRPNEVIITPSDGGNAEVDNTAPATGDDVTITVTPDNGKEVDEVIVIDENGNEVAVTENADGTYTYEQPEGDVTIEVTFKDETVTPPPVEENEVIITPPTGGNAEVDNAAPETGDDVTITVTPDNGKEVDEVIVIDKDGNKVAVIENADGTYTYEQPEGDVTIEVTFKDKPSKPSSSSGGGFSGVYNYPVAAADADGAKVTLSDNYATAGEQVTITITPDAGKKVTQLIVTDADGNIIKCYQTGDNQYSFTMPEDKVNVSVITEDADYSQRIVMQIGNRNILVNSRTITNDVSPVIVGDRTLVPVRIITELLGGTADWDAATRTVTLNIDGKVLKLVIDKEIPGYGTGAAIINDRTYVPVRYVAENLGASVEWIGATQQIIVTK